MKKVWLFLHKKKIEFICSIQIKIFNIWCSFPQIIQQEVFKSFIRWRKWHCIHDCILAISELKDNFRKMNISSLCHEKTRCSAFSSYSNNKNFRIYFNTPVEEFVDFLACHGKWKWAVNSWSIFWIYSYLFKGQKIS